MEVVIKKDEASPFSIVFHRCFIEAKRAWSDGMRLLAARTTHTRNRVQPRRINVTIT